ncbi:hypothetical protein BU23DRAFT_474087, partial [Bimuria novae-zelandiae CBS 107.79]
WAEYSYRFFHNFGKRTTSWLEAFYSVLKRYLSYVWGHLYDVIKDLCLMLQAWH